MIAGCDYSTRFVDIVLLDEDTDAATWHRFELHGQDAFDRARDVHRAFNLTSEQWDSVVAVGIEDPRGYGAGAMYRVQGAILAGIPWHKLVQPWVPSSWRKAVGLPGNASKGHIRVHALQHVEAPSVHEKNGRMTYVPHDMRDWPQDACDAYCIALATRIALERTEAAA